MKKVKAKDFDEAFDSGKDVSEHLNKSKLRRVNEQLKRVNIDFPAWMIADLDREANRLGVSRQALVKMWIAERFDQKSSNSQADRRVA